MAWRVGISGLLILAVLLPAVAAAPVEGSLTIENGSTFPSGARLDIASGVVLAQETPPAKTVAATLSRVHVRVYEHENVVVGDLFRYETSAGLRTLDLTNVTISTLAERSPDPSSFALETRATGRLAFLPSEPLRIYNVNRTELNSDPTMVTPPEAHDDAPFFVRTFQGAHLYTHATGTVTAEGAGLLWVFGPDLLLESDQGTTTLWTGRRDEGPAKRLARWAYLEFDAGEVALESPGHPIRAVALQPASLAWDGRAEVVVAGGLLRTDGAVYSGRGLVTMEGDLRAELLALQDGSRHFRLDGLQGDLRSTSLGWEASTAGLAASPVGVSPFLLATLLVGTVVASTGAAAGMLLYRERRRAAPPAPPLAPRDAYQHCLDYADFFEREDDPSAALECLGAARFFAEEDEYDVVLWQATCSERLGNLEEALEMYESAIVLAPKGDPEAAFGAAMVAGQLGCHDAALTDLRIALMADPSLLESLDDFEEDEDPFRGLRDSPEFKRLRKDARAWARTLDEE